jgi:hypothetical protein
MMQGSPGAVAPWVCVDDSRPSSGSYAQAAVMGEGTGWGILALQVDGSEYIAKPTSRVSALPEVG